LSDSNWHNHSEELSTKRLKEQDWKRVVFNSPNLILLHRQNKSCLKGSVKRNFKKSAEAAKRKL